MSEQPWETHDPLCPNRRPTIAFPNSACSGCRAVVAARAEGYARGLIEGDHGGRREGYRSGYDAGKDAVMTDSYAQAVAEGQRDERERHANELDVAVAKARAEVVTVNLEGDFNYVKGYNDGLVEGDAKGRREGERIGQERVLIAWKEAEPLHDAEVRADEREKAIERVEAWLDAAWLARGAAEFVRSAVIDALRGESNG